MGKKKNGMWSVIALLLAALSIWAVIGQTKNYSLKDFKEYLTGANPLWIVMAVLCMVSFIVFEGLAILCVLKAFGHKRAVHKGIIYSAADIYFSAITPSATGGQPACAFFMMADGVPTAVSAMTLLLNLVMYTLSLMAIGVIALICNPSLFIHFTTVSKVLIIIGYIILIALAIFMTLLIKREDWVHAIGEFFIRILSKIKLIRNIAKFEKKLDTITQEYRDCAEMIEGHRKTLFICFLFNFLQRSLQICVSAMVFLARGGSAAKALDIWVTNAFAVIGSSTIPVPGAIGVFDFLFLDGVQELMDEASATSLELASRGISFYICMLACLLIVAIGNFSLNRRNDFLEE